MKVVDAKENRPLTTRFVSSSRAREHRSIYTHRVPGFAIPAPETRPAVYTLAGVDVEMLLASWMEPFSTSLLLR